jgi:hypothetical protein
MAWMSGPYDVLVRTPVVKWTSEEASLWMAECGPWTEPYIEHVLTQQISESVCVSFLSVCVSSTYGCTNVLLVSVSLMYVCVSVMSVCVSFLPVYKYVSLSACSNKFELICIPLSMKQYEHR